MNEMSNIVRVEVSIEIAKTTLDRLCKEESELEAKLASIKTSIASLREGIQRSEEEYSIDLDMRPYPQLEEK
jgi:chromosome segregation ATPase